MAIEPGWKVTSQSAKNLARWDTIALNGLKDKLSKLPKLDTGKKLTVIDIGANTGCFAEVMLTETPYEFERMLLFEPASLYARWAAFKFSCLLHDPAVEIMEYALSDERGVAKLAIEDKGFDFGRNTMVESRHKDYTSFLDVITVPFDEIYETFQFVNGIDLIKINVEGYEVEVLNGMKKTLKSLRSKPPMLINIANGSKHHDMRNLEILLNNLKDLNYIYDNIGKWPKETFDLVVTQPGAVFEENIKKEEKEDFIET
jgi:FkbM family methyltransferase